MSDIEGTAGFTVNRNGSLFIEDSEEGYVFLSEPQVFQLFQRLQKEYAPDDENPNEFVEFYER